MIRVKVLAWYQIELTSPGRGESPNFCLHDCRTFLCILHLTPLASDQAAVCSPAGPHVPVKVPLSFSTWVCALPGAGVAHWILLSLACTGDNRVLAGEKRKKGWGVLCSLLLGLSFPCSPHMHHANLLTQLLKQTTHAFTRSVTSGDLLWEAREGLSTINHYLHLLGPWVTNNWSTSCDLQCILMERLCTIRVLFGNG